MSDTANLASLEEKQYNTPVELQFSTLQGRGYSTKDHMKR